MPDKTKQTDAAKATEPTTVGSDAIIGELQRTIEAKDRELRTSYALINHYKSRCDDLDLKLIETAVQLQRSHEQIAAMASAPAMPPATAH